MKKQVTYVDENGLETTKMIDHHVEVSIDVPVLLYAVIVFVAIVFCWWLGHVGQGQIGIGVLSGVLLITTYFYLQAVA